MLHCHKADKQSASSSELFKKRVDKLGNLDIEKHKDYVVVDKDYSKN